MQASRPGPARAAHGFQRVQDGGQALAPAAAGGEAGFDVGQGQRAGVGGQQFGKPPKKAPT
jgi:hypothetical protein